MVKISDCLREATTLLKPVADSPRGEAELMLAHLMHKDRLYIAIHKEDVLPDELHRIFCDMTKRRALGEPIAYIIGTKEFMSLEFEVNSSVLIPRPETEMLVEYIAGKYNNRAINIIDICTGSGAIACSLAHFIPSASIEAIDLSREALDVASRNAVRLGVDGRVNFCIADALMPINSKSKFDIAVSNPPYIESHVIPTLMTDVRDYEPLIALDGGNDGLIFYRKIVDNIESILNPGGELVFEIGYNQGDAVRDILNIKFKNVAVYKDASGNDRMVCGQLA